MGGWVGVKGWGKVQGVVVRMRKEREREERRTDRGLFLALRFVSALVCSTAQRARAPLRRSVNPPSLATAPASQAAASTPLPALPAASRTFPTGALAPHACQDRPKVCNLANNVCIRCSKTTTVWRPYAHKYRLWRARPAR